MPTETTIGLPFIILHSVDSTNNYAMGLVHAGMAQHGTVVFTHHQIKGKGQRQKQWHSLPDENITLSIIIKPFGVSINKQFVLSMSIAIGIYKFFCKYAGEETKVKWPNDLYWRDRKAGGALIENVVQGSEWKYAIIGIGLNINQTNFDAIDNKAVSLKQITGCNYDTIETAKELISLIDNALKQWITSPDDISKEYHKSLYKWKEKQRFKKNNKVFEATVDSVTNDGLLIVKHSIEEHFRTGEIEWLI